MKMEPVVSSSIHSTGHEGDLMHIAYKLKDGSIGKTYAHRPVTAEAHAGLRAADSIGKHLNRMGTKGVLVTDERGFTAVELVTALAVICLLCLASCSVYGWGHNLVTLYHSTFTPMTGQLIMRIVGIFLVPLGVVMGYL